MCNTFSVKSGGFFFLGVPQKTIPETVGPSYTYSQQNFLVPKKISISHTNSEYENARIQKEKEACIMAKEKKVAYRAPAAQACNNPSHDIVWL